MGNNQPTGHENTQHAQHYPAGCSCSECRTEGRIPTQPGQTCTATRWTDNNA